jgi:hypothetical protein
MMNKIKGYLICEATTRPSKPQIIKETTENKRPNVTIKAVLQEADIKNRNNRIYSRQILSEGLATTFVQERIKTRTFFGEAGHPLKPDIQRQLYMDQGNISHRINEFWWDGNLLRGYVEATNTSRGADFAGLILQGSQVAFSLRAVGPITEARGGVVYVKSPLTVFCYDWVIHPSHAPAYMEELVSETKKVGSNITMSESSDLMIPIYEYTNVESYLKSTSRNFKLISEQFEINAKNNIYLSKDNKNIYLKDKDKTIAIHLEDYLIKELDQYMAGVIKK